MADINISFDALTQKFHRKMGHVKKDLAGVDSTARKAMVGVGLVGGAAMAAGGAFFALKNEVMNSRLELAQLAGQGAQSIKTVQALQMAAGRAGMDFGLMEGAIEDLPERLLDASNNTGEMQEALTMLGGSIQKANGEFMNATEALPYLVELLQGVEDKSQRSALATLALGDGGRIMMTALGDTRLDHFVEQVERFGLEVGPEAVAAAREWKKETEFQNTLVNQLKLGFADLGGNVLPAVNDAIVLTSVFTSEYLGGITDEVMKVGGLLNQYLAHMTALDFKAAAGLLDDIALAAADAVNPFDNVAASIEKARTVLENMETLSAEGAFEGAGDTAVQLLSTTEKQAEASANAEAAAKEREAARQSLADLTQQLMDQGLEGERALEAAYARQLEQIAELEAASGDHFTADMARAQARLSFENDVAEHRAEMAREADAARQQRADEDRKEAEDLAADKIRIEQNLQNDLMSSAEGLARGLSGIQHKTEAGAKRAATAAAVLSRAVALTQIGTNTAAAITRQFADLPYPAALATSALIGVTAAVQAAEVMSQPINFHMGGIDDRRRRSLAPDERITRDNEAVGIMTAQGLETFGGPQGFGAVNAGRRFGGVARPSEVYLTVRGATVRLESDQDPVPGRA